MSSRRGRGFGIIGIIVFCCLLVFSFLVTSAQAVSVNSAQAQKVVKGWLKTNAKPLGTPLPGQIASVDTYHDEAGEPLYFVVSLLPEGYVIVSCDDLLEPVIAFSSDGAYEPLEENPLYLIMSRDAKARIRHLKEVLSKQDKQEKTKEQHKWENLSQQADQTYSIYTSLSSVTDMRVPPLIQSRWSQSNVSGSPCYNYYTPPSTEPDGDAYNNYPCGCVATAMAQLMRYHQHPTTAIPYQLYTYRVENVQFTSYPKGGDGSGGAYNWSNMPLVPGSGITLQQRIAIGGICVDAGLSCQMNYAPGGSGAALYFANEGLKDTFMYENAIHAWGLDGYGPAIPIPVAAIRQILNSNMDAALPVMLGIYTEASSSGGHAVLADGYGFDAGTLYHHINMGWGGSADAWYNLPDILSYDAVSTMNYNVYPVGTGEIISGRITDEAGLPIENVLVQALQGQTVVRETTTNAYGIYGLTRIPSNQTYTLAAQKENYTFNSLPPFEVGLSEYDTPYNAYKCGNKYEMDLIGVEQTGTPPTAYDQELTLTGSGMVGIELLATDDGLPGPLSYIITSLAEHGRLFDGDVEIAAVPYTLQSDQHTVNYQPCPYFGGTDYFSYKANDGGTPPGGGDSNIADVTLLPPSYNGSIHETGSSLSNYPFYTTWQDIRMQTIYHAGEMGAAKSITALEFRFYDLPTSMSNFTIRMQHTGLSKYTAPVDFINDGWTTVYQNTYTVPGTGWRRIDFQNPFYYNGTDNVLLDVSFNNVNYGTVYGRIYAFDTGDPNRVIYQRSRNSQGDPLLWTVSMFGGAYYTSDLAPVLKLHGGPAAALVSDFNVNCSVGIEDLLALAGVWMSQQGDGVYDSKYDISEPADLIINLPDMAVFALEWLTGPFDTL